MPEICFFNGKQIPFNDLKFRDFQRLRIADSLFESMIAINNEIPLLKYHLERLLHSCKYLQLDFPTINFEDQIKKLLEINKLYNKARIRITVFRTEGKLYTPNNSKSSILIEAEEYKKELFEKLNEIAIYSENKKPLTIYSLLKSGNALHYILAKQFAMSKNVEEVLLMNPNAEIIEGASNNVFFIHEKKIYTPSTSTGCVNGVFKKFLTTEIIKDITYASCLEPDLENFDEIFLTNAVGMIQPVLFFGNKKYSTEITETIIKDVKNKLNL